MRPLGAESSCRVKAAKPCERPERQRAASFLFGRAAFSLARLAKCHRLACPVWAGHRLVARPSMPACQPPDCCRWSHIRRSGWQCKKERKARLHVISSKPKGPAHAGDTRRALPLRGVPKWPIQSAANSWQNWRMQRAQKITLKEMRQSGLPAHRLLRRLQMRSFGRDRRRPLR